MKKSLRITDLSVGAINRKMSDLEEALRGVPDTRHVTTATPSGAPIFTAGTAGDPFTVIHNWGKVPTSFTWTAGGDTRIYATGEDRAKWSKDAIVLRGTTASTQIELTLFAHEDGRADGPEFHGTTTAPIPSSATSADKLNCATGGTVSVTGPTVARIYTGPDANATLLYSGGPLGTPSSGNASNLTSFPTLNQDTTGKAAKLSAVTGGTSALNGPTAARVFTVPDADSTLLYSGGALGAPSSGDLSSCTFPTLNQNTTGSAAKWTTARNLAGNSVDGSANVAFSNKFVVQGTTDTGLSGAQFLGALATGIVKNTTTTGVLSIAAAGDFPTLNQDTTGSAAKLKCTVSAGSLQVNGPTVARLMTAPDAAFTVLYDGGALGTPSSGTLTNCTFPTLNQNTTGSAAKWTTARNLAGNSVDGSANVAFANKFIVQGTADAGLSGPQFLGALATGIVKNTTTTGVLSIAAAGDFPTLNQDTTGAAGKLTCATGGTLAATGPTAARIMTTPDAAFTVARTDAGNAFTGDQTISGMIAVGTHLTTDGDVTLKAAGNGTGAGAALLWTMNVGGGFANSYLAMIEPDAFTPSGVNSLNFYVGGWNNDANVGSALMTLTSAGRLGVGVAAPLSKLHLPAGSATANTAPLQFTSGTLETAPRAGVIEFLTDAWYGTITTGAVRKTFAFLESPSFTTPTLGVATATSINKVAITAPTTSSTLTVADGKTLSAGGNYGVAWAKYSFDTNGGAVSTITPGAGFNTTIPDNSIITAVTVNVTTAVTSGGSATVAIGTSAGSSTTSLLAATAKASLTLDALINGVPTFAVPIKLTAAGSITFTIGTAALTAGVIEVFVQYYTAAA